VSVSTLGFAPGIADADRVGASAKAQAANPINKSRSRVCFLLASRYIAARKKVLGPLRVPFFYPNSLGSRGMDWPDYLRDEAAKYRQLAEQTDDPAIKIEMLELASVCEEVANDIEDHLTGG
jgi:hypothetical protein